MIDFVCSVLEGAKYQKAEIGNENYIIFYRIIRKTGYIVSVSNYRDPMESSLSGQMMEVLNMRVEEILRDKGAVDVQALALVATYSETVASDMVDGKVSFWVLDVYHNELVIPNGQPEEFLNIRKLMTWVMEEVEHSQVSRSVNDRGVYNRSKIQRIFNVNNFMVFINVMVFIVLEVLGSTESTRFMMEHGAFFWEAIVEDKEIYRFFSCMFIHFGFSHLFSNMIVLFFLGDNLERNLGKVKYLIIYFGAGLSASIVSCIYYYFKDVNIVSGGASGAIFGVVGALLYLVWRNKGVLEDLSINRLILFVLFSFYSGVTSTGVDNAAHVGGFFAGMALAVLLYKKPKENQC